MNKLIKSGLALVMGLMSATGVMAQGPMNQPMPLDTAIRSGVLPNGLTYYIRHNENPKGQADFYIAQKVGSILEEDNQRGLAHFLEHMCFNGTENFPKKGIINWLESIGVKFGYNLNAYTSVDETVYNISSVPVARQSVQDSCLLILHDWSCALSLEDEEIEAERGVIHEEWRRSAVGQMRLIEQFLPKIYPDNKYGQRLPIGIMDVVDNFPPQAIKDYYHTWYRPDQQGIIVVGDIDVDYIEGKIKEMFSPIPMPENAKERYYVQVEDTPGTIYAIGADKEMTAPTTYMMFKVDKLLPREVNNTIAHYAVHYMTDMVANMLSQRLEDIANRPDAPFAMASAEIGDFFVASTKDALSLYVIGKDDLLKSTEAAYRELLRAVRGGFTVSEYERACSELRSNYQRLFDSRNDTPTDNFSRELVRVFIENEPAPGIEVEKQIMDMLSQQIPLEAINEMLPQLVGADNRVVMMMLPEAEGVKVPTEEEVAAGLASVDAETIEPYKEELKDEPLIPSLPAPGAIVSETHNAQWDATEFVLSNGVHVIVKPTNFKENEIKFEAIARGGYSSFPESAADNIIFMPYAMGNYGLGTYTNTDIKKYLQGKQAAVSFNVNAFYRELTGSSNKQDLATLFELLYAHFTEYTINEDEFAAAQNMISGVLANQESTPDFAFGQLVHNTLFTAAAEQQITTAAIKKADCAGTVALAKALLANAKDFTFNFVGNIDMDVFKPLMLQYLATLPVDGKSIGYVQNAGFEPANGSEVTEKSMVMSTPQEWAFFMVGAKEEYTAKNQIMVSMLSQILSTRLLNKVREEMGATYSIFAGGNLRRQIDRNVMIQIPFPFKPEMKAEVIDAVNEIIEGLGKEITAEELGKVREYLVKEATASLEENEDWSGAISATALNGVDTFNGREEVINSITVDDLTAMWREILSQNNRRLILLSPEAAE